MRWDYPPLDINPVFPGLGETSAQYFLFSGNTWEIIIIIIIIITIIILLLLLLLLLSSLSVFFNKEFAMHVTNCLLKEIVF